MKKAQATMWIIAIAVILIVIAGIIFYMIMNTGPNTNIQGNTINNKPSDTTTNPIKTQTNSNQNTQTNTQTSISTSSPKTYNIDIKSFAFNPKTISIKKGDTIIWTNSDSAPHTVTSDSGSELGSETLQTRKTYSHTFGTSGTFNYHCTIHSMMKASVVVE